MSGAPRSSPEVLILGAGSTGLGVALGLGMHSFEGQVLVVEKATVPGGLAGSMQWNGHVVDKGPHRLATGIEVVRVIAEELLGPDLLRFTSQHGVQLEGKCYQFPPRVIDWITPRSATLLGSFATSFAKGQLTAVTTRFSSPTFESLIVNQFGQAFYEKIAAPMATKVWAPPADLDPSFVTQRFSVINPFSVMKRALLPKPQTNPSTVLYPRHGFQQIWDEIARWTQANGTTIEFGTEPTRIDVEHGKIVRVHVKGPDGERVVDTAGGPVVSTIPLPLFVRLLQGVDAHSLSERCRRLRFRSMLLVLLEFDQEQVLPYRNILYPEASFCFNRIMEQNLYSRDTVKPGKAVLVADLTMDRSDPRLKRSDAEILAMVIADVKRLRYVELAKLTDSCVRRIEYAYVVPDSDTRREMYNIHHELKAISNLHIAGRFSAGEYDNSDHAIDNGITLAGLISGRTTRIEYLRRMNTRRQRVIVE